VMLNGVPAFVVELAGATEKCVTTAGGGVELPPPHPPAINNALNKMKSIMEFLTLSSHSGYRANQMLLAVRQTLVHDRRYFEQGPDDDPLARS